MAASDLPLGGDDRRHATGGNQARGSTSRQTHMTQMTPPTPIAPVASNVVSAAGEPELGEAQRHALQTLREDPEVRSVELVAVTLVTGSVQALVQITAYGQRPYRALLGPSGRTHRI